MIIETFVNLKYGKSGAFLPKGIHDDKESPFPDDIYDEIECNLCSPRKKWTLKVLDDGKSASTPVEEADKEVEDETPEPEGIVDTLDDGGQAVTTEGAKRTRTRKKQ